MEGCMKPAVIFWIPSTTPIGYSWGWRSGDGKTKSNGHFAYYHDCLADAKAGGHAVALTVGQGNTAPGWWSLTARAR